MTLSLVAADLDIFLPARDTDRDDTMMIERRHGGSRVKIARPIRVVELCSGRHIAGRSRDISSTGMRLEIPVSNTLRPGDAVQVDVGTLSGIGPLTGRRRVIAARVVWVNRQHKMLRPLLTLGVEFSPEYDALVNVA